MKKIIKKSFLINPNYAKKEGGIILKTGGQLAAWRSENWTKSDGSPCGNTKAQKNPARCKPSAKWKSMSSSEKKADNAKKKREGAKGKQFVSATKKGKVTKSYTKRQHGGILMFRSGGNLGSAVGVASSTFIPLGNLHAEKNNIPSHLGFGTKGLPVIACSNNVCEKQAEIEKNEIIFPANISRILEKGARDYNAGKLDKLSFGGLIQKEIMSARVGGTIQPKSYNHADYNKILKGNLGVLDSDGNIQSIIEGANRIFSIKDTKKMLELALSDKKEELADYTAKALLLQDKRKPEFVYE